MEPILRGPSAMRYIRVPPLVRSMYPQVSFDSYRFGGARTVNDAFIVDNIRFPLHMLAESLLGRTGAKGIRWHLVSGELPIGSVVWDEGLNLQMTSPLMTLFTLSRTVSDAHLLMAMYEFCGTFTLFKPAPHIEQSLARAMSQASLGAVEGWQPVRNAAGKPTNLWKRPPLIELHELHSFAREVEHLRGGKRFDKIAAKVSGVTASPFEVQASLLFGLRRSEGGKGLGGFTNNHEIRLTRAARRIAGRERVYADLYFEGKQGRSPLVIECQGGLVHGTESASLSDADRIAALQAMGIDVLPLTYKQISDPDNFERIAHHVAAKLGRPYREKSERLRAKEDELQRSVFIDWLTLGE